MSALARVPGRKATSASPLCSSGLPLTPVLRQRIEDAVEALLAFLDADDPDPDLEPSFGYLPAGARADECEDEDDLDVVEVRL